MKVALDIANVYNKRIKLVGDHQYNKWHLAPGQVVTIKLDVPEGFKPYISELFLQNGEEKMYVGIVEEEV
jgi:hypothetical protein